MKQINPLLFVFGWLAFGQMTLAQEISPRGCATHEYNTQRPSASGSAGSTAFENWLQKAESEEGIKSMEVEDALYYIPVVVHVLHNGEAIGTGKNLAVSRIQSQIDILNNDFGRAPGTPGFNSNPAGTDSRIRFCLAAIDPNGQPTTGINRINTQRDGFDFLTENESMKNLSFWDPNRYLNIWTCKFNGSQYIGYAQYPFLDSIAMPLPIPDVQPDGVVIEYRVFGDVPTGESGPFPSYSKGRTATHEIGHYLGLIHIWGDGLSCADNASDYCDDTPPQANYTAGCPTTVSSCNSGTSAMFQNYMDYTNDVCMNVFTNDQKHRMRIVLRNAPRRKTILTTPTQCGAALSVAAIHQSSFSLFPSQASEFIYVENMDKGSIENIMIKDISGRSFPCRHTKNQSGAEISIAQLQSGLYWLELKTNQGKIWRQRFIKQ